MPLWIAVGVAGFLASAVLALVVGAGWSSLSSRCMVSSSQDFNNAWFPAFFGGLAMTVVSIGIAWKMGVDVWMMVGG